MRQTLFSILRQLRKGKSVSGRRRLPPIALTAFARPEDQRKSLEAGFDLHLSKPLKLRQLLAAIRRDRAR